MQSPFLTSEVDTAVDIMDLLSSDILINIIFPLLPKYAMIALQCTSWRYQRLVLSIFPYETRKHLEILDEICAHGCVNLLRWFLGREKCDLGWSPLFASFERLFVSGKLQYILLIVAIFILT